MHLEYNLLFARFDPLLVKDGECSGGQRFHCHVCAVLIKRCRRALACMLLLLQLLVCPSSTQAEGQDKDLAKEPRGVLLAPRVAASIGFSNEGKKVIWNCDGVIHTWNLKTTKHKALAWKGGANSVALSPDDSILAIVSHEERKSDIPDLAVEVGEPIVTLWKVKPGQPLAVMKWKKEVLVLGPVVFSPDGRTLAAGTITESRTRECKVPLWEVPSGKLQRALDVGKEHNVRALQFSPDGKTLATGGRARNQEYGKRERTRDLPSFLKLWDVATGKMLVQYNRLNGSIYSVAFSPDGKLLAVGGDLGKQVNEIVLWDIAKNEIRANLIGHRGPVYAVMFSHDGKLLASGGVDGELKLWDAKAWQEIRSLQGHTNTLLSVAFSPDDSMLATGGLDGTVRLWYLHQPAKNKRDP